MYSRTIEPRDSRFRREFVDGVEQIRIPLRRNWFVLLFLSFWICGWTVGGLSAMSELATNFDWFLAFWLGGWVVGWGVAAITIASQVAGSEVIRVVGGNLEIGVGLGKLRWRRLYRTGDIRYLDSSDPNPMGYEWWSGRDLRSPFRPKQGAIKFDYGSQTIYAAASVDEPEGRLIVDWLRPRLPRRASDLSA